MGNLARKTVLGFTQLIAVLGIVLFAPAWALDYWQAWVYLFVFAASSALITIYLWKNDTKLLERRINAGPGAETEKSQKSIQLLASFVFIGAMILTTAWRASDEERFLFKNLSGYKEYCLIVRYRLVPFVW